LACYDLALQGELDAAYDEGYSVMNAPESSFAQLAIQCGHNVQMILTRQETANPIPSDVYYGYQNLAVDTAFLVLFFGGTDEAGLGYLLGSPLIHLFHDEPENAGLSIVLRLGVPLLAGGLMCGGDNDDFAEVMLSIVFCYVGVMVGMGVAVLIDDLVLAWETRPPGHVAEPSTWWAAPAFDPERGSAGLQFGAVW
jgi:hypothetical protein